MINFILGLIIGGLIGVCAMCILQINRDNKAQRRINKAIKYTKEQLEYSKKDCVPARGIVCEKLLKILGGDVDDE